MKLLEDAFSSMPTPPRLPMLPKSWLPVTTAASTTTSEQGQTSRCLVTYTSDLPCHGHAWPKIRVK